MSYRIGIIGGDGIGPEVVAEALKVRRRGRRRLRGRAVRPRWQSLPARPARSCPTPTSTRSAASTRSCSARSAPPTSRRACSSAACSSSCASSSTSTSTCARSCRRPSQLNDGVDMIVIRENTEGTYAGEGGFLRKGTPHEVATQGSVNTRMGVERCDPLRVRPRAGARPQAPHARAQDQRAHVRRRPLAARVRRGRGRVPRRRRPATTTSTPRASTSCRIPSATT